MFTTRRPANFVVQFLIVLAASRHGLSETDEHEQSASQLFNILGTLQPFRSQFCQFKFENCVQDSSYADQLDNDCNIYSRLRDCFRALLDESQCLSMQLKRQYKKAKQNEYESCGIALSYESINASMYTSSSTFSRTHSSASLLYLLLSTVLVALV